MSTDRYKLIAFDNSDGNFTGNPKVLGRGTRAEVVTNLKMLRKGGLPGMRYVMYKDKQPTEPRNLLDISIDSVV